MSKIAHTPVRGLRMTDNQLELLARIVRTNGGGISIGDLEPGEMSSLRALHRKKLAHAKSGHAYRVVHTAEGLAVHRAALAKTEGQS